MIRHTAIVTASVLVALSACGSDGTTEPPVTEPPTTEPPTTEPADVELPADPDAVVLQLDVGVNQPNPIAIASGFPLLTVYADGRVIASDRSIESGPLPPLTIARLDPDGVRALLALAISTGGLDPLDSYGRPNVADADGLRFVVATADRRSEFGVYALGLEGDQDDDISPDQLAGRDDLARLRDALLGWQATVADHVVEPPVPFHGDSVMVVAKSEGDALGLGLPVDLAGGATFDNRVASVYCVEVVVADAPEVVEAIVAMPFDSAVAYRQVLPHEPGCAIVPDQ